MPSYAPFMTTIKGAKRVMDLHVKPGQDVLIVTTNDQEAVIPETLALAAQLAGAGEVIVASISPRTKQTSDVPRSIAEAAKGAQVVFSTCKSSLAFTTITKIAGRSGGKVKHISMDMTPEQLASGGIMADYHQVQKLTLKLSKLVGKSKQGRVLTDAGTDIRFGLGRSCAEFFGIPRGVGLMPWWAGAPDGEAMVAVMEDTAEGKIVADVTMVSAIESLRSCLLAQPIEMEFKNGTAVDIRGGAEAAAVKKALEGSDDNAHKLCEFAIGTNPESRICGIHEDKSRLGTCHFAIGANDYFGGKLKSKVHLDFVVNKPTILLDGRKIMEKGKLLV